MQAIRPHPALLTTVFKTIFQERKCTMCRSQTAFYDTDLVTRRTTELEQHVQEDHDQDHLSNALRWWLTDVLPRILDENRPLIIKIPGIFVQRLKLKHQEVLLTARKEVFALESFVSKTHYTEGEKLISAE